MGMATNGARVTTTSNWNQPLLPPPRRPSFQLIFLKGQPKSLGYIISGSLAIAAENTESRCLVSAALGWNIVSAVASALEFVILIVDVVMNGGYSCDTPCVTEWVVRETVFISLIIASVLELCVSISTSSFGCSSLIQNSVSQQQIFVTQTDGLIHNMHPTISHLGVSASSAVALIPQYPAFPATYGDQKNMNMNNPNTLSQPQ
ncbi:membrane-spanning 4-domains subfamily A member 18-like isoform 3-T4 [Leptodactylus fuscus]|uniref:membrane-spanning 4-domains subfamily A member 18-like isoform X3 n=1 Tax=Leptodactylus fuscus TaxID=238119 RepID=UPI003F4F1C1F